MISIGHYLDYREYVIIHNAYNITGHFTCQDHIYHMKQMNLLSVHCMLEILHQSVISTLHQQLRLIVFVKLYLWQKNYKSNILISS